MPMRSKWPAVSIPEDVSWAEYIMKGFGVHGDRTAIVDPQSGQSYTYPELKDLIHKMASALTRKGFKQGEVLAIMCPNIPEFAIAYFAAILIGGIVTSMNPLYTGREVAHQLVHSQASWLLTVPPCIPRAMEGAKEAGVANVYVVGEAEGCASLSELLEDDGTCLPTDLSIKPREDIAALPYSSGTTGLPKGVQLTHYNLIADSCIVMGESFTHYSRDSHVLALLPFYHSYGLMVNLANVLLVGGRVVCIQRFDQEAFLKTIQNEKITHAALVPPIMIFLAKHEMVDQYDLSSLIDITVGAAGMGEELMQSVKDRLSNLKYLRQGYGMTELSPVSHVVPLDTYNPKSVGVLLPNLECKIIDLSSGEEVEQGKEGEICIRGPTVMKGYLKNPEATARTLDSEGWLHTGDIGHCDQGDFFYITDRLKELIKYKGFQVPPAELEALLLSHPDVEDVAVIGVPDVEAGELPKAFVVRKKESLTVEDVTGFVNSRVAPYKRLRGGVEFTDEIPKSTSGKILRRELKRRELERKPQFAEIVNKRDANVINSRYPDVEIPEMTLPDYVMEFFYKYGNVPAITDCKREQVYTYTQLLDLVPKCAAGLIRQGLGKGDVMMIYSPNVPSFVIILLATLKAGGSVTTANPLYTPGELAKQMKLSCAKYLFTVPALVHRAREAANVAGIDTIFVDGVIEGCKSFAKLLKNDGSVHRKVPIDTAEDVAVIPFSSGTTGLPKGVMLTHRNVVANCSMMCADDFLGYDLTSVVLAFLPFFHSYGMSTLFTGLRLGVKLVCMDRFEKTKFLQALQDHNVSHTLLVPPVATMLAKDPFVDKYQLTSLVEITCGAATLSSDISQAVFDRFPLLSRVRQGYGMTELSPVSHFTTINNTRHGTVGQLLPNLQCKVVDIESGKSLGPGVDGEICVRGPSVMKGYLNDPDSTSQIIDADGWLHTGDLGHFDIDENFYIVDRLKELIKYKGYQVPPAELEAILVLHPSITDAAVIGVPDDEAGELPRAYVVSDGSLTEQDVMQFVEERVAPYKKLRGGVEFIDSMPRSVSGKILRRELKAKLIKTKKNTPNFKVTSHDVNRNIMSRSVCCVII